MVANRRCALRNVLKMKVLVLVALLAHQALAKKLPPTFLLCSRDDPNLSECFTRATQKALSLLTQPVPELSLQTIDPMRIERIEIPAIDSDSFKFSQLLSNVELINLKETKILKSEVQLNNNKFAATLYTKSPWLKFHGNYLLNGKVLLLYIQGEGKFYIELDDVEAVVKMTGGMVDKKGKQHLTIADVDVKLTPKNVKFHFENLFKNNPELTESTNQVLSDSWRTLYEEIGSIYESVVAVYLKNYVTRLFNKVPYDDLFPPK